MCCRSVLLVTGSILEWWPKHSRVGAPQVHPCIFSPSTTSPEGSPACIPWSFSTVWIIKPQLSGTTRRSVSFIQTKMLVRNILCVLVLPPQPQLHPSPSLKPGSYEDHPSLAARFKPSQATREQSSSFYGLQRRRSTPSQTHCAKVKQAKQSLSQPCTTVDVDLVLDECELVQHTQHWEPFPVTVGLSSSIWP